MRPQGVALEHHAHVAPVRRQVRHITAARQDAAFVRIVQSGHGAQQRGLAASGRSQKKEDFPGGDFHADAVQHRVVPEPLGQVFDRDGHRHVGLSFRNFFHTVEKFSTLWKKVFHSVENFSPGRKPPLNERGECSLPYALSSARRRFQISSIWASVQSFILRPLDTISFSTMRKRRENLALVSSRA